MKIRNLIIGSEGFVGNSLCNYLETKGEHVKRFDIRRTPEEDGRSAVLPLREVDRVYFLAWDVGGAKYLYRREIQFRQLDWNLKLLLNIMPQLQLSKLPFLFVSSQLAEEYDTVYGVTKRLGEVWTHLLEGVRLRLWNVYGVLEKPTERSHVVSDFVYQAFETNQIRMLTTGEEKRQFIHISDVCDAFHSALENGYRGVYDVTTFEWVSILDVAKAISVTTGAKLIPGSVIGSTPLTPMVGKIPGWSPRVSLEEGLEKMVRDIRAQMQQ